MKDQYEEDPYFRTERDDPNEEERAESLNECLSDIAGTMRLPLSVGTHLAGRTRVAEIDLKYAKNALVEAQDNLIDALQAEIDHMGE